MKKRFGFRYISVLALFLAAYAALNDFSGNVYSQNSRYEGKIVRKIEFTGNESVSSGALLYAMKTSIGYPLNSAEVRQDIKEVFDKGQFEKVDVEIEEVPDGVKLRFICKERARINSIDFKGNDEFVDTDLEASIPVKAGDVFRTDLLEKGAKAIKAKYDAQGLFNAVVSYRTDEVDSGRDVKVSFIIDEGEEIVVKKISILGTRKIDSDDLLDLMTTKEEGLFRDGAFKKEEYEMDKDKILAYYRENGYLDAQITGEKVEYEWDNPAEKQTRVIFIVLNVDEGDKYFFDGYTVKVESEKPVYTPEALMKNFKLKEKGELFNDTMFQQDRQSISFKYASQGYIFARVVPEKKIIEREIVSDGETVKRKFVKVDITITEGTKAYVENIIIKGNQKTKDHVIRRELLIKEGELFNSDLMQLSREKVYNLGYFKQVNFDVRPGSREGQMNLVVDVEEQPSGTISLGGGYGTTSGFSIFADITENNFMGNGQIAGIKFSYGPYTSSITLSFTERWLFNKPIAFNSSISYGLYTYEESSIFPSGSDTSEYQKQTFGYSLGLSYRFWYYFQVGTSWYHVFKSYINPTGNSPDYIFEYESLGVQEKRTQTVYLYRDTKNNYLNPTSGTRVGMSVGFTGGFLGGGDHFMELNPELYAYYSPFNLPFLESHPCVFEFRANGTFLMQPIGSVNQDYSKNEWLDSDDRLRMGGPETIRGWDYYDTAFPKSWANAGLYHRVLYGLEFRVPIHPQMLWLAFFFDAGSLWSDNQWEKQIVSDTYRKYINNDKENGDLHNIGQFFDTDLLQYFRYSYGAGLRVQIPMMPLRFWFGKKMIYDGDKFCNIGGWTFQFQIGDIRY